VKDGINGGLDLAIEHGGIHALESLIMARYYMFTQVYFHKTRRVYDYYLKKYMQKWKARIDGDLTNIIKYDDIDLLNDLRQTAKDENDEYYEYAYRICRRKHHSVIYEISEFAGVIERRKAVKIFNLMAKEYEDDCDMIIEPVEGDIHDFFVEGVDEAGVEFYVIRNNRECLLTNESHVIRYMPKKFQLKRIYADIRNSSKKNKDFILGLREIALAKEGDVR